ncbi:unnamed protein product [Nesidiocoris tenuis]|uniref:Uncharacterized protein n=1 Tax=Nesidiocoris tenuis TaxID=355587 RepID=A0A6H5GCV2_9HEMI|nr:unnamed protein product [Nesidiocoris tenuis]
MFFSICFSPAERTKFIKSVAAHNRELYMWVVAFSLGQWERTCCNGRTRPYRYCHTYRNSGIYRNPGTYRKLGIYRTAEGCTGRIGRT